ASLEDKMTIKMKQMMNEMKALVVTTPALVKAVEEAPTPQIKGVSKMDFENYVKENDAVLKNVQNQQINVITTRSGKTLEEPLTPLVPTPDVSIPSKEPEQNPKTLTEKVQNPNLENTTHVPPPEEEDSIFIEIPKPKAKKTVNVEIKDLIRIHLNFHTPRE
ncbi:hypothetical protein Tco_0055620, partial [Tanacetum coccineum]